MSVLVTPKIYVENMWLHIAPGPDLKRPWSKETDKKCRVLFVLAGEEQPGSGSLTLTTDKS